MMNPRLVRWARRIDWAWSLLALTRRPWQIAFTRASTNLPEDPEILVLDLHLIGDAVMLLPFLAAVRRRYPRGRITVVAGPWSSPVLSRDASADCIIEFAAPWVKGEGIWKSCRAIWRLVRRLRSQHWDIGIDMRGDIRNILVLYFSNCARRFGFDFTGGASLLTTVVADDGRLTSILDHHERLATSLDAFDGRPFVARLSLTQAELAAAERIAPYVGFHFGASVPLRRLPIDEAVALLSTWMRLFEERVLLFSATDMEDYVAGVLIALSPASRAKVEVWRGSIRDFVVVASRARVMFTMDSGPAHLAAATGCPTVVIFGPNRAALTAPRGSNVKCVEMNPPLLCQPCDQRRCVHATLPQACLRGRAPEAIAAALLFSANANALADELHVRRC